MPNTTTTAPTWGLNESSNFAADWAMIDEIVSTTKSKAKAKTEKKEEEMTPVAAKDGFTFGCDPEYVVVNDAGNPVSADGLIPGNKQKPFKVDHGAIQVDGMAAEINIDPVSNFADFNRNITAVTEQLEDILRPKGCKLLTQASVIYSEDVFNSTPDKAKELGCTPDYNAWTGEMNLPPDTTKLPRLRTFAGHLHVGWTQNARMDDLQHVLNCRDLVKQFDWFLGAWSLRHDTDKFRRQLYGQAGACRIKDYGVEYRVLSNFWLTSTQRRIAVWNRMQAAINGMAKEYFPDVKSGGYNKYIIEAINTSVPALAIEKYYQYPLLTIEKEIG